MSTQGLLCLPFTPADAPLPFDIRQAFYKTNPWRKARRKALEYYKSKCQECLAHGQIVPAVLVHHDYPLEQFPQYGLELFLPDGTPNLLPLCFECHERIETERGNRSQPEAPPLTDEWW